MDSFMYLFVAALLGLAVGRFFYTSWVNHHRVWRTVAALAFLGPLSSIGEFPSPAATFFVVGMLTLLTSMAVPDRRSSRSSAEEDVF